MVARTSSVISTGSDLNEKPPADQLRMLYSSSAPRAIFCGVENSDEEMFYCCCPLEVVKVDP